MMKQLLFCIIVFISIMLSTVYAQNQLQLADTLVDELGTLRHFKLNSGMPEKNPSDGINILKIALGTDENTEFKLIRAKTNNNNQKHLLYQQLYKTVPVYDGYYYLHFKNEIFTYANGEYAEIKQVSNSLQLDKTAAINLAIQQVSADEKTPPSSTDVELILWRPDRKSNYKFVYKVLVVYPDAQKSRECMVDAATGEVLAAVPVVCSINIPCTGATVYSGNVGFTGDTFAGGVRLRETRNGVNISILNNQNNVNVNAVDFVNPNTAWTSAGVNEGALDVHFATEQFLDYFRTTFNRNSIDNNGHAITSYTNRWTHNVVTGLDEPMDNAFFNPNDVTFSFGQGNVIFNSVTSLDVVAHEMGHGIAFFEVGFNNTGEARSLNEGFSDIWGATVENWSGLPNTEIWMMGEQIMANGFSCLRSLRNPNAEGFRGDLIFPTEGNYPDTRTGTDWETDNTPAHVNATVLGHWYFLLSQGDNGTNDLGNAFNVSGLGIQTAAQIAYNTELNITPGADFMSVRVASIAYATQQWGANSCEVKSVTDAWYAVGVGRAYLGTLGMSVIGDNNLCTTSNSFSISNLPAGATVVWSATPSGIVTVNSPNSLTTTLSKIVDGVVTLKATVSNLCGSNTVIEVQKQVIAGPPPATIVGPYDPIEHATMAYMCAGETCYYIASDTEPGSSYLWTLFPPPEYPSMLPTLYSGTPIYTSGDSVGIYILRLAKTNSCGTTVTERMIWAQECFSEFYRLSAYPNPTTDQITVSIDNETNEVKALDPNTNIKIEMIHFNTGLKHKEWTYKNIQKQFNLNLNGLNKGIYILRVTKGKFQQTIKIIIN